MSGAVAEDIFAPLRHLEDPTVVGLRGSALIKESVKGRLGALDFDVAVCLDGYIIVYLKKNGGRITKSNVNAFWRKWGYEPPQYVNKTETINVSSIAIGIPEGEIEGMIKITPKGTSRGPVAEVKCDCCGATENIRAAYERRSSDKFEVKEGQVILKATQKGWSQIKGTLRCPECETNRRKKEDTVKNVVNLPITEEPRQPSRDQKREIIALLNEVYDTNGGRYTGGETDKTVAETIGGGVMLGWVAQIREDLFGPDGGNDDLEELRQEISAAINECSAVAKLCNEHIQSATSTLKNYNAMREKLVDVLNRVDKLKKSVGPKGDGV